MDSKIMNLIRKQNRHYLIVLDLKSKIKNSETQNKHLENYLEKLRKDVFALSYQINLTEWKIKRAKFILSCEKKRHENVYSVIETTRSTLDKKVFLENKGLKLDLNECKANLEKTKSELLKHLEELKK